MSTLAIHALRQRPKGVYERQARAGGVVSFRNMVARDTSSSAAQLQDDIHRRFSPAERLRMAFEMSEFARSLSRAGLRSRRPELTESELDAEMIRQLYGVAARRDDSL